MKKLSLVTLIIVASFSYEIKADIFGSDDRFDIIKGTRDYKISRSVAVGVLYSLWDSQSEILSSLYADNLSDFLCKDEKFYKQKSVAYACTGFLIGEDLLVTAGHCSTNGGEVRNSSEDYCESYTWMFDFYHTTNVDKVPKKNIYNCKEILYAVEIEEGDISYDFALIRLDRKVKGRNPLKLAKSKISVGDKLTMYGHPMGMPMKVTRNGSVIENIKGSSFKTSLDAFAGNSGSPVLNKRNEVVGLLVAGNPNETTYRDNKLGCDRYNYCDENGGNCKSNSFDPEGELEFPETFSEVQSMERYRSIINKYLK